MLGWGLAGGHIYNYSQAQGKPSLRLFMKGRWSPKVNIKHYIAAQLVQPLYWSVGAGGRPDISLTHWEIRGGAHV